jgi:hypothetical protein
VAKRTHTKKFMKIKYVTTVLLAVLALLAPMDAAATIIARSGIYNIGSGPVTRRPSGDSAFDMSTATQFNQLSVLIEAKNTASALPTGYVLDGGFTGGTPAAPAVLPTATLSGAFASPSTFEYVPWNSFTIPAGYTYLYVNWYDYRGDESSVQRDLYRPHYYYIANLNPDRIHSLRDASGNFDAVAGYSLFKTAAVPEGGASMALIFLALGGLGAARRFYGPKVG